MRFIAALFCSLFLLTGHSTLVSFNNAAAPGYSFQPVTKTCKQVQAGDFENIVPLFSGFLADECNDDDEFSFAKKKPVRNAGQPFLHAGQASCPLSLAWHGRKISGKVFPRFSVPAYIFLEVIRI